MHQRLFHRARHIVRAIEDGHLPQQHAAIVQRAHLAHHPLRLRLLRFGKVADDLLTGGSGRDQVLFDAVGVLCDQRVRRRQNFRRGAVIFHHHDGLHVGERLVEFQQISDVCAAPSVDRLIRVTHDEEVTMISAQRLHQLVLQRVDILKLVDHDIFKPLLPLEPNVLMLLKNVERELDEVVVVESKAFFLLIEIAVEDDVSRHIRALILFAQRVERHRDHVPVIVRLLEELADLDHVPRGGIGHVAQRKAALFINDAEHRVDIRVIQHQKALRILNGVAVLLQNGDAEAVERVDIARVVVAGQRVDALAHLVGRLVRERHAQDVPRQDAELIDKIGKAVRQRPRLARAGARDHADIALRCRNGLALRAIQPCQQVLHALSPLFAISMAVL